MYLKTFGWTPFFDQQSAPLREQGLQFGRVNWLSRGLYKLFTEHGEQEARLSGRLRHRAESSSDLPAVGDWVAFRESGDVIVIDSVLARRTKFSRKAAGRTAEEQIVAANVDKVLLLTGLDNDYNLRRIERYLAIAWESGAQPIVVLNKADLCQELTTCVFKAKSVSAGVPVYALSSLTGEGLEQLHSELVPAQTVGLVGSSGVGKSTLLNRLLGEDLAQTAAVRPGDNRGRHTTTTRYLVLLASGALMIDTPGMRELGIWESNEGLNLVFDEIETLASNCAFSDCTHSSEPRCAVLAAVEERRISPERLENFRRLQRELRYLEVRRNHSAKLAEKKRWKAINKAMRNFDKRK